MKSNSMIVLWVFIAFACTKPSTELQNDSYVVFSPIQKDTSEQREYVCDIQAIQNVELRSKSNGYLEQILIDEGQFVTKGQLLFRLNNLEQRENLRMAEAALKLIQTDVRAAELELRSSQALFDQKIIGQTELEKSKIQLEAALAKYDQAQAEVSKAQLMLSYCEIRAPFSGYINRISFKTGSYLEEGNILTSLSDNQEVYTYFHVSEKEYLNVQHEFLKSKQSNVELILANGTNYPIAGKIETVEGEFDKATGDIAFRARFENPEQILKHGATGKVVLRQNIPNALLIPQKSTFELQDRLFVYVLDKNGRVEARPVTVRSRLTHLFVLESGLSSSDKILYEGFQNVKSGEKINYTSKDFSNLISELTETEAQP